jgi:hypothetical protein
MAMFVRHDIEIPMSIMAMFVRHDIEIPMGDADLVFKRYGLLADSMSGGPEPTPVVCKNRESVPGTADRDVELLAVDQLRRESRIDIDNDVIDGRALRRD